MENIYSVLVVIISVLGSTAAFRYYEKRALYKERDEDFIRNDCRDRISKLEALLVESAKEKDELRKIVLDLTREVGELTIKVAFLQKENANLHKKSTK